jgi:hypothetical protein
MCDIFNSIHNYSRDISLCQCLCGCEITDLVIGGPWFEISGQIECVFEKFGWKGWIFSENFNKVENNLIYAKAT